jgi:hypothetical protein
MDAPQVTRDDDTAVLYSGSPMLVAEAAADPVRQRRWSPATRVAFRFAFSLAAISVFQLVSFASSYLYFDAPRKTFERWLEPVSGAHFTAMRAIGASVIRLVTGSADTVQQIARRYSYPFCYLVAVLVVAAAVTTMWSALDRRRQEYATLNRWLRVYARYALALVTMIYAMVKVVPTQFGYLTPGELLKPVGQLNRFWMLWNFMVVSTSYTVFAGLVELIGCVLLFFRRSALLGALLLGAALTNVLAMDLAYGVLGAAMVAGLLVALAAIVVAPYAGPLANVLLLGRSERMPEEPATTGSRWRYAAVARIVVLAALIAIRASDGLEQRRTYFGRGRAVYGMFEVERFVRGGTVVTPLASDTTTWKKIATDGRYGTAAVSVQFAGGEVKQYSLAEDTASHQWILKDGPKDAATLHYAVAGDGSVSLDGQIGTDSVQLRLRPVDLAKLPLLGSR